MASALYEWQVHASGILTISHRVFIQLFMFLVILATILKDKVTIQISIIAAMLVCPLYG